MFAVIPPSKDDSRPRETSFDRSIPLPRSRPADGVSRPRRRPNTSKWTQSSVTAFVVAFVPGTTRRHTNGCTTALQCIRQAPACSYLRPAPRLWHLNHPLIARAPSITPAATVLPRLAMIVAQSVTSVGPVKARSGSVCPRLPPRHSFHPRSWMISGRRIQKLALILRCGIFPVRHRLRLH